MTCIGCDQPPSGPEVWRATSAVARLCASCGIVTTSPPPAYEDTLAALEDQHGEAFYAAPAAVRARWLARLLPRAGRVLEIGCGAGQQLQAMARLGLVVTGVEAMPARAARAREAGLTVCAGFFEHATPSPAWDAVYHTDLLSHVADPMGFLSGMRAWLAQPDGLVALEVGAFPGSPEAWSWWLRSPGLHVHRRFYTPAGVRRLLDRAGLEVVAWDTHDLGAYVLWLRGVERARAALGAAPAQRSAQATASESAPPPIGRARQANERVAAWLRYGPASRLTTGAPQTVLIAARFR